MSTKRKNNSTAKSLVLAIATSLVLVAGAWAAPTETVLYSFTQNGDGVGPEAGLVFDTAGNLYGTTHVGGLHALGTVFKLSPSQGGGWSESILYSFTGGADGQDPVANLVLDANGNLYGTAQSGGVSGSGVVFELSPSGGTWTYAVLYSFTGGLDGQYPASGVVLDSAGNLVGTAKSGGSKNLGVVFQLTPSQNGWIERVVHNFAGGRDDENPAGTLTMDRRGRIYGTCAGGVGSVFRLTRNPNTGKWGYKELYYFGDGGGETPSGGLAVDSHFHVFGTTYVGCCGFGNVFELEQSGSKWTLTQLYGFLGHSDGANPVGGLVRDAAGNLYGTTQFGGDFGTGVVFEMALSGGTFTQKVLHSFAGVTQGDGSAPDAGLILDTTGSLFGTTLSGGANGEGSVFEMTQ